MLNNLIIVLLFVAGIIVQALGFFNVPHMTGDIVAILWAWPTGWAAGSAFAEIRGD